MTPPSRPPQDRPPQRRLQPRSAGPRRTAIALLLGSLALVTACGEPPSVVDSVREAPAAGGPFFAGVVELTGELAGRTGGAVFVAVRPAMGGDPLLVTKIPLGPEGAAAVQGGVQPVRFLLEARHWTQAEGPPSFPQALLLYAFFDADGDTGTKDDMIKAQVPVRLGDRNIRIRMPQ